VEAGCGYGAFTIPVAQRISGKLTTFDLDRAMIERARRRADGAGVPNVVYVLRDVLAEGCGVELGSKDACLLFNIPHADSSTAGTDHAVGSKDRDA
jgi:SAM-dependent methyltransferase